MSTNLWQRIEGFVIFIFGIYLAQHVSPGFSISYGLIVFFIPDFSLLGYFFGKRVGAHLYNFTHFYGLSLVIMLMSYVYVSNHYLAVGALLFAHCGFDRMLGYGLKDLEGFRITHLGIIGRK